MLVLHFYSFQDDTAFEKQSAIFALAISDVVIINMYVELFSFTFFRELYLILINDKLMYRWCTDIGRENAANKPLLRTVFEVLYI